MAAASPARVILPDRLPAMPDNDSPFRPDADPENDDGGDNCRICRGDATHEQPLFYPCKCSGSIRYVHQDCLMEWLAHSKKKYCELCKAPFHFTKLYDKSMPNTLPLPLFLRQMFLHGLKIVLQWSRYALVILIWLVCLPWCIRQVWRGLFWLADGSWVSDAQHQNATLLYANTTLTDLQQTNAPTSQHVTLPDPHHTPLSISSLFASLIRLLTGETLLSKLFRLLFSLPPLQISASAKSSASGSLTPPRSNQRPPSLLSNTRFLNKLTTSTAINNLYIDVAEGLVICLSLVTGFILVFLIREWVINQQPPLNIPDLDIPDHQHAAAPAADVEGRPIIRPRRRRLLPQGVVNEPAVAPLPDLEEVLQPPPGLPPRRAFTEDNIALPPAHEQERPELPVRATSLTPDAFFASTEQMEAASNQSLSSAYRETVHKTAAADDSTPPPLVRPMVDQTTAEEYSSPPPLVRGAVGEVVNVHRSIEERVPEASKSDFVTPPLLISPEAPPIAETPPLPVLGTSAEEPEQLPSLLLESPLVGVDDREGGNHWLPATELALESYQYSDSDGSPIPTPPSEDDGTRTDVSEVGDSGPEILGESVSPEDTAPESKHLADTLIDWLWRVDGLPPPPTQEPGEDATHIVDDLRAEAPFVPIQNGVIVRPVVAAPHDHAPIQIEWNDQNAADDAEDLEGVLELIGMEGPLVGMIQNVIFSLFLITLTLTASIWIPYVWGKLALIFIAHPMTVAVNGPVMLISTAVDMVADFGLFVLGIVGLLLNQVTTMIKIATIPIFPSFSNFLDTELIEGLALNATKSSGIRLENAITGAAIAVSRSSDLPKFSLESHRSLVVFKASIAHTYYLLATAISDIGASLLKFDWSFQEQQKWVTFIVTGVSHLTRSATAALQALPKADFASLLKPTTSHKRSTSYLAEDLPSEWSTQDKIIAIALGYAFFALAGFIFMKGSRLFLGLRKGDKVPGTLADGLRQAGGVLKVIVIVSIEMLVFPLYCGLLLDLALLPLFESATVWTRLAFIRRAPFTGLFLHWFVGTCYMFHFALFVSMCRKILRRGVLYFIRDPDDPEFHPVRDVLERPVLAQLGKIFFSALIYGGLVIMCLGGVVWSVSRIDGVLPIHWSTPEPRLAIPIDVIFYNFMLPFIVRKSEPSKKLAAIYEWWFRGCAHGLRLSHFLFGEEREDEKMAGMGRLPWSKTPSTEKDGSYVLAPGSDSCRVPKGQNIFLEVSEDNQRLDGKPDQEIGLQGKTDDKWAKIYLPPKFKARLAAFIVLLWIFAAGTGMTLTIVPLVIGRFLVIWASSSLGPVNDLYAFTVGLQLLGLGIYVGCHAGIACQWIGEKSQKYLPHSKETLPHIWSTMKHLAGLLYLVTALGAVLPFGLSLIAELYICIPIFTFLVRSQYSPTIFILQGWTLGLLYTRAMLHIALNYPSPDSRISIAIRAIVRNGYMNPDVKQATRAVILPLTALCIILLAAPLGYAKLLITGMRVKDAEQQLLLYRYAYPGLLGLAVAVYGFLIMGQRLEKWRMMIRDEVYLVGERLQNYVEKREKKSRGKGKEKEMGSVAAGRFVID